MKFCSSIVCLLLLGCSTPSAAQDDRVDDQVVFSIRHDYDVRSAHHEAAEALVVENVVEAEDVDCVELLLRNNSDKTISAWSMKVSDGSPNSITALEDRYHMVGPDYVDSEGPIGPGEEVTFRVHVETSGFSPDRFDDGNFEVFSARVGAVFFDDGTFTGGDISSIEKTMTRRFIETMAAIDAHSYLLSLHETNNSNAKREHFGSIAQSQARVAPANTAGAAAQALEKSVRTNILATYETLRQQGGTRAQSIDTALRMAEDRVRTGLDNLPPSLSERARTVFEQQEKGDRDEE